MKITKDMQKKVNNTIRTLDIDRESTRHMNCFRFHNKHESKIHRRMKFELCEEHYDNDKPFLCEAWTSDKKSKFDFINLLDCEVIECVVKSDTCREKIPTKVTKIYGADRSD